MAGLSDKEREELVAYLDGELDEAEARALEARLNRDAQARAEAVSLRKTWELLDYLPKPEPSSSFTHKTMERLSAVELGRPRGSGRRWRVPLRVAGWAAAVLLAAGAGFAGVTYLTRPHGGPREQIAAARPDPLAGKSPGQVEDLLVKDLRILENKRLYENIDHLEFLKALDDPELFGDER